MSGVVRMNMSESSYAIDSAWSLLQNDDKIEKTPFIIPAAMALYGGLQGYRNVKDNKVTDPFLGIKVGEGDGSLGSTALEFGTGVAQGFVPGGLLGAGAKRAGGKVAARHSAREAAAIRAREEARQKAARDLVGAPSFGPLTSRQSLNQARALGPDQTGSYARSMGNQAYTAAGGGKKPSRLASTFDSMGNVNRKRGMQGAVALGATGLIADYAPKLLGAFAGPLAQTALSSAGGVDTSGYGASSAGATGATNTPVIGNREKYQEKDIWQGKEWSKQHGGNMAVATGEEMYIADRLLKGEKMFTDRLGNELLNEVEYRLHKAHCGTELKADCPKGCKGCPECDGDNKKKADDKKKPAHGMVIVIGSKAGPGPSKNGKREKLDSEKKKE